MPRSSQDAPVRQLRLARPLIAKSRAAHDAYLASAALAGHSLFLPLHWVGSRARYPGACSAGHIGLLASPNSIRDGRTGWCFECSTQNPDKAKTRYIEAAIAAGIQLDPIKGWQSTASNYWGKCHKGHYRKMASPNSVQRGNGFCRTCAKKDPEEARKIFIESALAAGVAIDTNLTWRGSMSRYPIICPEGHETEVAPASIQQGKGWCWHCRGHIYNLYYITASTEICKPGVTSGRARLIAHARTGLAINSIWTGLDHDSARIAELIVLEELSKLGIKPILKKEYFAAEHLKTIKRLAIQVLGPPNPTNRLTKGPM